jgi:alcohol dehydrogenase
VKTARLFTPGKIIVIDVADSRLAWARSAGAHLTVRNDNGQAIAAVMDATGGMGADLAVEAVGVPETFELATDLVRPGGRIANVGVHGHPATLHLEKLWARDVTITTGLVDTWTIPQLLKLIESGWLDATDFATHRFSFADTECAYDTFADAARTNALKVVLRAGGAF